MGDVAVCGGDRALFEGLGRTGKQCDVLAVRKTFASVRFEDGQSVLCLAKDLHPIQRRPPPMF
ncbi:MAG: hypothetical protein V4595_09315 [Pseudomonadota bacterium]